MPSKITEVTDKNIWFEQGGQREKAHYTFWRGLDASFHPNDASLEEATAISEYVAKGLMPSAPFIGPQTAIVAFGSCFAEHISDYLNSLRYNVLSRSGASYVSRFGDGIVNTFAIRQQFEWAWTQHEPKVQLWHGYDRSQLGYDENVRQETAGLFNNADVFIITFGLSELWFDEPTGEVFWRAPPKQHFDPARHKFRMATYFETLENITHIHRLIRGRRPNAKVIFTVSPIPLSATFRPISCLVADSASKALIRAALDEFIRGISDGSVFYFPSYETVTRLFNVPYIEERRHVHKHVLDFNMRMFERYYCQTNLTDSDLFNDFKAAVALDRKVAQEGHWSVPRLWAKHHPKPAEVS